MDEQKLQDIYRSNKVAARFFDHMASRQRNQGETKIHRIMQHLNNNEHEVSRAEIVDLFKKLEEIGCGRFVPGRWGYPSRFVWEVGSKDISLAAMGESVGVPEDLNDNEYQEEFLTHTFNLRMDLPVEFKLPVDLTVNEAERLAAFVKTLPLEEYD